MGGSRGLHPLPPKLLSSDRGGATTTRTPKREQLCGTISSSRPTPLTIINTMSLNQSMSIINPSYQSSMTSFNVIIQSMNDIIVIIQSIIQSMNDIIVIIQSTSFALHAHGEMPTHSLNGMTPKKGLKKGVKKGSFLGVQKGVKKGVKKGPFLDP